MSKPVDGANDQSKGGKAVRCGLSEWSEHASEQMKQTLGWPIRPLFVCVYKQYFFFSQGRAIVYNSQFIEWLAGLSVAFFFQLNKTENFVQSFAG